MTPITKSNDSAKPGATPAFLIPDERVPASLRELLLEADGCFANGFYTGSTACAQRALEALLKLEKADGATLDAKVRALGEKAVGMPPLYLSVLTQLGDNSVRDGGKLTTTYLQLLLTTLKAAAYEIYVVGPDRLDRMQHVRRLLDATDRKSGDSERKVAEAPAEQRKATPDALMSMGAAPGGR